MPCGHCAVTNPSILKSKVSPAQMRLTHGRARNYARFKAKYPLELTKYWSPSYDDLVCEDCYYKFGLKKEDWEYSKSGFLREKS
jgi:hypothetical protein